MGSALVELTYPSDKKGPDLKDSYRKGAQTVILRYSNALIPLKLIFLELGFCQQLWIEEEDILGYLKGPKHEKFVAGIFTQIRPV